MQRIGSRELIIHRAVEGKAERIFEDQGGSVNLLGVRISALPVEAVIERISQAIESRERAILAYANVYSLNLAYEQPWFREFLNAATLTFCDGFGVKWGARLVGHNLPYRYTPPDWFPRLAEVCVSRGYSLYFLGARPGVAELAANQLRAALPGLQIAGTQHGYFDRSAGSVENTAVVEAINEAQPDLLVIGLGQPAQERWLADHWAILNVQVALPVGAMFDYLTGKVRRAPRWMTDHGLEWLGRFIVEPGRLARRYLIGNPLFLWRLFKQRSTV